MVRGQEVLLFVVILLLILIVISIQTVARSGERGERRWGDGGGLRAEAAWPKLRGSNVGSLEKGDGIWWLTDKQRWGC